MRNTFHDFSKLRWRAWGYFLVSLLTLAISLLAALASQVASANDFVVTSVVLAVIALLLAGAISVTVVPFLARRARSEWFRTKINYKVTREGWIYFSVTILVGLSAVNTGNNLLFIVLSAMLASIVVSGVASRISLNGLQVVADFPERIFAGQPVIATILLTNPKTWLPSFSIAVEPSDTLQKAIVFDRTYFPFLPGSSNQRRRIELCFNRRGRYAQSGIRLSTQFPFGFIVKSVEIPQPHERIVFPAIRPSDNFFEILPLVSGEFESYLKGRGMDLYSLRDYVVNDSARAIHWKASAKTEAVKVKEFAREDEKRLLLVFDPSAEDASGADEPRFEAAVSLCAGLAQHFFEEGADLCFLNEEGVLLEGGTEEVLDQVLTELALLEMRKAPSSLIKRIQSLSPREKDSFKILFTMGQRGTLPTSLWQSSHVIFVREIFSSEGSLSSS